MERTHEDVSVEAGFRGSKPGAFFREFERQNWFILVLSFRRRVKCFPGSAVVMIIRIPIIDVVIRLIVIIQYSAMGIALFVSPVVWASNVGRLRGTRTTVNEI
jgi:hypothetical protein